jgi:hypothetical protein
LPFAALVEKLRGRIHKHLFEAASRKLLIRPKRNASPRSCHPERSAAESRDLRLFFASLVEILRGRINKHLFEAASPNMEGAGTFTPINRDGGNRGLQASEIRPAIEVA